MKLILFVLLAIILFYFYSLIVESPEEKIRRVGSEDKRAEEELMMRKGLGAYWIVQVEPNVYLGYSENNNGYGEKTYHRSLSYKFSKLSEAKKAAKMFPKGKVEEFSY